jgi:ribosomal protein L29
MENVKMKVVQEIIGLRYELDNYKEDRDWDMVRKIRMQIARLETLLSETY